MSLNIITATASLIDVAGLDPSTVNTSSIDHNSNLSQSVSNSSTPEPSATNSLPIALVTSVTLTDVTNPTAAVALAASTNTTNPIAVTSTPKSTAGNLSVPAISLSLSSTPEIDAHPVIAPSILATAAPSVSTIPPAISIISTPKTHNMVICSTPTSALPTTIVAPQTGVQPIFLTTIIPPVLSTGVQPRIPATIALPVVPINTLIDGSTPIQIITPTLTTPPANLNDTTIPTQPIELALTPATTSIIVDTVSAPIVDTAPTPAVPVSFVIPPTIPTSIIDNLAPTPAQPIPSTILTPTAVPTDNIIDESLTPIQPVLPIFSTPTDAVIITPPALIPPTPALIIPPKSTGTVISTPSTLIPATPVLVIPPVAPISTVTGITPAPISPTPVLTPPPAVPTTTVSGDTPVPISITAVLTPPPVTPTTTVTGANPAPTLATPIATTSSNPPAIAIGTNNLLNIQNGIIRLQFTPGASSAAFNNEMGAFVVDDEQGRINGILPGAPGYLAAAMKTAEVIGGKSDNTLPSGNSRQLIFKENTKLGFYLVQNGSTAEVKADLAAGKLPSRPVFFQTGNTDGEHLKVNQSGSNYTFNWEDTVGGGDRDFNDLVINATISNSPQAAGSLAQGLLPSIVDLSDITGTKTASMTVGGNSSYNNSVGFYRVDNLQGTIGTINPGDPGYAEAAISRTINNCNTKSGEGNTSVSAGIFAPYIIANGTAKSFLAKNPTNQGGSNVPNAYFAYIGSNPDKVDHVRLLGDNKFGFEDMFGGGDRDFNDAVVQLRVTT